MSNIIYVGKAWTAKCVIGDQVIIANRDINPMLVYDTIEEAQKACNSSNNSDRAQSNTTRWVPHPTIKRIERNDNNVG